MLKPPSLSPLAGDFILLITLRGMKENYSIEDLTFQMEGMAVYKAKSKDGQSYALTVLTYDEEIICRLDERKFEKGLRDLTSLKHRSLTKVVEGGVDERDQQVWIIHKWNEGRPLENVISHRSIETDEMLKLKQDADSLIAKLGDRADAICFSPRSIFLGRTSEGELLTRYVIDYWQWFHDWALGLPFGGGRDAGQEMVKLLASLDNGTAGSPQQVRPAAPPTLSKGPMIVLPGNSSAVALQTPATVGTSAVAAAQVASQPAPKTRKLVTGYPTPYPLPTPQVIPGSEAGPATAPAPEGPKTTRTLLTSVPAPTTKVVANRIFPVQEPAISMTPVIGPSRPVVAPKAAQSSMATLLVTTPVPAHTVETPAPEPAPVQVEAAPPQQQAQSAPAQAPATRSLVTSAPAAVAPAAPSTPKTKTGASMQSTSGSGRGAIMAILALVVMLTIGIGVLVKMKDGKSTANASVEEPHDERLGPKPGSSDAIIPTSVSTSSLRPPKVSGTQPVAMTKPEPRPFVPLNANPAEPGPVASVDTPPQEPRVFVKKLPEVSPDIRPDDSQVTALAVTDTEGLAAKVNTWVSVTGEIASTSVDGQWAFAGEAPLVAQLRNGQLSVVTNKMVEVLGWLADEKTLIVAEEYDISYPESGVPVPVEDSKNSASGDEGKEPVDGE